MKRVQRRWAVQWRSRGESWLIWWRRLPLLFRTRKEARAWIEENYGYIRTRQDLRTDPHFWRMPKAVLVSVSLKEVAR